MEATAILVEAALSEQPGKRNFEPSIEPPAKKNKHTDDQDSSIPAQIATAANVIVQFQSEDGVAVGKYYENSLPEQIQIGFVHWSTHLRDTLGTM